MTNSRVKGGSKPICFKGRLNKFRKGNSNIKRIDGIWYSDEEISSQQQGRRFGFAKVTKGRASLMSGNYEGHHEDSNCRKGNKAFNRRAIFRFQLDNHRKGICIVEGVVVDPLGHECPVTGTLTSDMNITLFRQGTTIPRTKNQHKIHSAAISSGDEEQQLTLEQCSQILQHIRKKHVKLGGFFREPVDPIAWEIPTYHGIIKEPMDLGTIHQKMQDKEIITSQEFAHLVRLVFQNAMTFNNDPLHVVHQVAKKLLRLFDRMYNDGINERMCPGKASKKKGTKNQNRSRQSAEPHQNSEAKRIRCNHGPSNQDPVFLQSSDSTQCLTEKEQIMLVDAINSLQEDHIPQEMIQIIREAANLSEDEDEIELDVQAMDSTAQVRLFRHPLVSKYAKMHKVTEKHVISSEARQNCQGKSPLERNQLTKNNPRPTQECPFHIFGANNERSDTESDVTVDVTHSHPPTILSSHDTPKSGNEDPHMETNFSFDPVQGDQDCYIHLDGEVEMEDLSTIQWTIPPTTRQVEPICNSMDPKTSKSAAKVENDNGWSSDARQEAAVAKRRDSIANERKTRLQANAKTHSKQSILASILKKKQEEEAKQSLERKRCQKEKDASKEARAAVQAMIKSTRQTVDFDFQREMMKQLEFCLDRQASQRQQTPAGPINIDNEFMDPYDPVSIDTGVLNWVDA